MLTEKDYCDYETCVALEKLGFPIKQIAVGGQIPYKTVVYELPYEHPNWQYCKAYHPPLYYEAQKWLREEKGIVVDVSFSPFGYFASMYTNIRNVESEILKERFKFEWSEKFYGEEEHDSYEEALFEGIKGAVKILKEK